MASYEEKETMPETMDTEDSSSDGGENDIDSTARKTLFRRQW